MDLEDVLDFIVYLFVQLLRVGLLSLFFYRVILFVGEIFGDFNIYKLLIDFVINMAISWAWEFVDNLTKTL